MPIRHFFRLFALLTALVLMTGAACAQETAMNILLIGVDTISEDKNGRSDTMLLVRADPAAGEIRMVSFLRDLYVQIPGVGKTRLNAAYYHGGEALLKQTLLENFAVSVDRTVTVHFSLLADLVDQIGGVEVDITEKERQHLNDILDDYNASYGLSGGRLEAAGLQRLDGRQALCFSRIRKIDSDFQRTSRQQTVIAAMLHKAASLSRWDQLRLAVMNLPRVRTDLTIREIAGLLPLLAQLQEASIRTAHVPFEGAYSEETINGMMVLVPDIGASRTRLQRFLD